MPGEPRPDHLGPWIRPWGSMRMHGLGGDFDLTQRDLDYCAGLVNAAPGHADLREAASDLYKALVTEHGHDEQHEAPWPSCLPVHMAMNRYQALPTDPTPGQPETPE